MSRKFDVVIVGGGVVGSSAAYFLAAQLGFRIQVLSRGQRGLYHGESGQEDFLVVSGECLLVIEGEERPLQAWNFVHCPPWTKHTFVGAAPSSVTNLTQISVTFSKAVQGVSAVHRKANCPD